MTLDQIREQLLEEHLLLRRLGASVELEAARLLDGAARDLGALRAALVSLHDELKAHNRREEEILRGVLRTLDAWGVRREELMDERHEAEHGSLAASLCACARLCDCTAAASHAKRSVADVIAHIEDEEREILAADVLSDDVIKIDYGGC